MSQLGESPIHFKEEKSEENPLLKMYLSIILLFDLWPRQVERVRRQDTESPAAPEGIAAAAGILFLLMNSSPPALVWRKAQIFFMNLCLLSCEANWMRPDWHSIIRVFTNNKGKAAALTSDLKLFHLEHSKLSESDKSDSLFAW